MNPLYLNLHILIKCIKLSTRFNVFTATPGVNRRVGKFINFFSVVRFSNEGCTGAGGLNGTCYTKDECRDRNGAATSSCAGHSPAPAPAPDTQYYYQEASECAVSLACPAVVHHQRTRPISPQTSPQNRKGAED